MTGARTSALLAAALLAGCATERSTGSEAIGLIGGALAFEDEAAVALISNGRAYCSGALISPSVVLTAAHCIAGARAGQGFSVFFGDDVEGEGRRLAVRSTQVHPEWTGSLVDGRDIGMVLLAYPQDPALPLPLNRSPIEDHVGDPVRRIGFGVFDRETREIDGRKREGQTVLHTILLGTDYYLAGDPDLATCHGDSGGPTLLTVGGVEHLAGVHSFGFNDGATICVPPDDGDVRVDVHVDDFILPWLAANDPVCGDDGTCAWIGCPDDPDCARCAADGECVAGCETPDPDCPDRGLSDGCRVHEQCDTGLCVNVGGAERVCTRACDPGADDCPLGLICRALPGLGDLCAWPEPDDGGGGCRAGGDAPWWLLAAPALALATRRRRPAAARERAPPG